MEPSESPLADHGVDYRTLGFDLIALPLRAQTGEHRGYREHGTAVAEITKGEGLWLFKHNFGDEAAIKFGHVFYIEWGREAVFKITDVPNCDDYFLTLDYHVDTVEKEIFYEFDYRHNHYQLIKFQNCD